MISNPAAIVFRIPYLLSGQKLADAGDHWTAIVRDLPAVLSMEVQTLP